MRELQIRSQNEKIPLFFLPFENGSKPMYLVKSRNLRHTFDIGGRWIDKIGTSILSERVLECFVVSAWVECLHSLQEFWEGKWDCWARFAKVDVLGHPLTKFITSHKVSGAMVCYLPCVLDTLQEAGIHTNQISRVILINN